MGSSELLSFVVCTGLCVSLTGAQSDNEENNIFKFNSLTITLLVLAAVLLSVILGLWICFCWLLKRTNNKYKKAMKHQNELDIEREVENGHDWKKEESDNFETNQFIDESSERSSDYYSHQFQTEETDISYQPTHHRLPREQQYRMLNTFHHLPEDEQIKTRQEWKDEDTEESSSDEDNDSSESLSDSNVEEILKQYLTQLPRIRNTTDMPQQSLESREKSSTFQTHYVPHQHTSIYQQVESDRTRHSKGVYVHPSLRQYTDVSINRPSKQTQYSQIQHPLSVSQSYNRSQYQETPLNIVSDNPPHYNHL